MYFIIPSTAATLFKAGKSIQTAADAAVALRPIAGRAVEMLLVVGLFGTGFTLWRRLSAGNTAWISVLRGQNPSMH